VTDLDLADWLTRQLDDEESAIKRLGVIDRGGWHVIEWYDGEFEERGLTRRVDLHSRAGSITANGALPRSVAEHIARWDPARVLAEIAAKRRLLANHEKVTARELRWTAETDTHEMVSFESCVCLESDVGYSGTWPCEDLIVSAAPYAGRPGWKDEWAVT
jgi:uncharacterized protein DUF6221